MLSCFSSIQMETGRGVLHFLILIAGDIATNPGPIQTMLCRTRQLTIFRGESCLQKWLLKERKSRGKPVIGVTIKSLMLWLKGIVANLARRKYIADLSDEIIHNNSKPFWRYVHSKRIGTNDLVLFKLEEIEIIEDIDIAVYEYILLFCFYGGKLSRFSNNRTCCAG